MTELKVKRLIQIAGVIDTNEAELIINSGVNYLGFPLRLPVNKEDLSEEEAKRIIAKFPGNVNAIAISYSNTSEEAIDLCTKIGAKIIQLHGPISTYELKKLREENKWLSIIKSLVIKEQNFDQLIDDIKNMQDYVDAFITDTFDPETGASGATGKTHDWQLSRRIVEFSTKPVILAGGLNLKNVREAIMKVKPSGIDVHTGIEDENGRKDQYLLNEFLTEAEKGFKEIEN